MKQLLILSGKGGTGKTTIASAFIRLSDVKAYADCDVDAPNLHLVMGRLPVPQKEDYYALPKAEINTELCINCGQCIKNCRFKAITEGATYKVDPYRCEGCGVCELICTAGAISLKPAVAGELILYADKGKVFSTAKLKVGSGTSGKLVADVKKQMKSSAPNAELAIVDGSPGIGCPVIASLGGADMALIVAEPTISGISDMERIVMSALIFKIMIAVCINKYDINSENSEKIKSYCKIHNLPFVGMIPFDADALKAINNGQTIVDIDCISGRAVKDLFDKSMKLLWSKDPDDSV